VCGTSPGVRPTDGIPCGAGAAGSPAVPPDIEMSNRKELVMSLTVPAELLEEARTGAVDDEKFVECVRTSLPYAWSVISGLVDRLPSASQGFADNQVPPPDEAARGQLLRVLASDAMRGALERHFGVRLAFQNCHRVAVFAPSAAEDAFAEFVSPCAQILNQSPEFINC
jgi:hypothetical protein